MSVADIALSPVIENSARSPGCFSYRSDHCESIVIYLTVAGSVIPMRVLESDSIASVKLRIQTCKGFVAKKQKLVYEGRELARDGSLVKDYGVTSGDVLHLFLRISDLLVITVATACGREFEIQVDKCINVGCLKKRISEKGSAFVDFEDQEIFCNGEKLDDMSLIYDVCKSSDDVFHLVVQKSAKVWSKPIERDLEISVEAANFNKRRERDEEEQEEENNRCQSLQIESKKSTDTNFSLERLIVNPEIELSSTIWDMLNSASEALVKGKKPIRSSEGTGGTYFMQHPSGNRYLAVFKPIDEEPMAVNNPQGLPLSSNGEGLKRGTRVGEGALREVAAYLLDHPKSGPRSSSSGEIGFAGVPHTVMARCLHPEFNHPGGYHGAEENIKVGSLQMFMSNCGSCEDMGPRDFPVEEVHKISVLDIRTANTDRHAGNILVSREEDHGRIVLIPIDHGYCLPEKFEDCTFDWLYWPQAQQPFSAETLDYIKSLDAEQDIALLSSHGWDLSMDCARTLRLSTMLLKKGAERGLSPYTIGSIMCRETLEKKSLIEQVLQEANDSMIPGMSEAAFLEIVSEVLDFQLDKLVNK